MIDNVELRVAIEDLWTSTGKDVGFLFGEQSRLDHDEWGIAYKMKESTFAESVPKMIETMVLTAKEAHVPPEDCYLGCEFDNEDGEDFFTCRMWTPKPIPAGGPSQ